MNAVIFSDLKSCQAVQAEVDGSLGYPAPGRDVGGGRHTPPEQSITQTYTPPLDLSDGTFAYLVDDVTSSKLSASVVASAVAVSIDLLPVAPDPIQKIKPAPLPPDPIGPVDPVVLQPAPKGT